MIFLSVLKQVIILIILISVGVVLTKTKVFSEPAIKAMTHLVIYFSTPCIIIKSFVREFEPSILKALIISAVSAVLMHLIYIIFATLIFRQKEETKRRVLRFAAVFGNCGFMSLPLQEALLGADGVIYGAAVVAVFNLFAFSYGRVLMSGGGKNISIKKVILNPAIIALPIGILLFGFSIPLPQVIYEPIGYFAALNTPLPMLIIGYYLANANIKTAIRSGRAILCIALKLLVLPVVVLAVLYLFGIRGDVFISVAICACAPVAAFTTMFSAEFNQATDLSVALVSLSTLLSVITMPIVITFSQILA